MSDPSLPSLQSAQHDWQFLQPVSELFLKQLKLSEDPALARDRTRSHQDRPYPRPEAITMLEVSDAGLIKIELFAIELQAKPRFILDESKAFKYVEYAFATEYLGERYVVAYAIAYANEEGNWGYGTGPTFEVAIKVRAEQSLKSTQRLIVHLADALWKGLIDSPIFKLSLRCKVAEGGEE